MYQEIILDHYKNPHGRGLREPFQAEVHHVNPTCGDEVTVRVQLGGGEGLDAKVEDLSYDALGEAFETLDAYLAMVQGRGKVEPDEDVLDDAVAFAGVAAYPARVKCALLGWMAFKDAVAQAQAGGTP
jgi:nitrogen fixation NifU-like protein